MGTHKKRRGLPTAAALKPKPKDEAVGAPNGKLAFTVGEKKEGESAGSANSLQTRRL